MLFSENLKLAKALFQNPMLTLLTPLVSLFPLNTKGSLTSHHYIPPIINYYSCLPVTSNKNRVKGKKSSPLGYTLATTSSWLASSTFSPFTSIK